jgi:orotate phosphoribosyltransferase
LRHAVRSRENTVHIAAMELIPSQDQVLDLLHRTESLRYGHFAYPGGLHSDQYLETALAMRHYTDAKHLSVGLSRKLRMNPEIRAMLPELSIVAATAAGLPVAFGLCEALRARQVYWVEKPSHDAPMKFRQYIEPEPGEPVALVDDTLRAGVLLGEAKALLELRGARVVCVAVLVRQPTPVTPDFAPLPVYSLATLDARYYAGEGSCKLCQNRTPLHHVGRHYKVDEALVIRAGSSAR